MSSSLQRNEHVDTWLFSVGALVRGLNIAAFLAGLVLIFVLTSSSDLPGRSLLTLLLFAVGPGSGLALVTGRFDTVLTWIITFAASFAVDVIAAQMVMSVGGLRPLPVVVILVAVTSLGVIRTTVDFTRKTGTS